MDQSTEVIPLTVMVPQSSRAPRIMEVVDRYASVRAVFVERDSIESIPDMWRDSCGFYILFSPLKEDGSYSVYVGKSDKDFRRRLRSHNESKDYWTTALLVQRESVESLSSTHASFLEGAMRDIFDAAPHVKCRNIAPTGDHTLHAHENIIMRQVIDSTLRMMLMRGYRKSLPTPARAASVISTRVPPVPTLGAAARPEPPKLSMSVPTVEKKEQRTSLLPVPPSFGTPAPAAAEPTPSPEPQPAPAAPEVEAVTEAPMATAEEPAPAVEGKKGMFSKLFGGSKTEKPAKPAKKPYDKATVLNELTEWRDTTAKAEHKPKHYVIENYTLDFLADRFPQTESALLSIPGIKSKKRDQYGDAIMEILGKYEK